MLIRVLAIAMTTICLLCGSPMALAQPAAPEANAAPATPAGAPLEERPPNPPPAIPGLSSDEAAREIHRRHGGRVLSVQADGLGYRVKVLKNGEVRIYQINP